MCLIPDHFSTVSWSLNKNTLKRNEKASKHAQNKNTKDKKQKQKTKHTHQHTKQIPQQKTNNTHI